MIVYVLKRNQSVYNKNTGKRPLNGRLLNVRPRSPVLLSILLMFLADLAIS